MSHNHNSGIAMYQDERGVWRTVPTPIPLRDVWSAVCRSHMLNALAWAHGNQLQAAKALGISRTSFNDRMKKYGIPRNMDGVS